MGDPKRVRKKYNTPQHPWESTRMEEEAVLIKEYGLKNKKEIWRLSSLMRKYTGNAKNLIASRTKQSEIETHQLLTKLQKLGLLQEGSRIEDVLGLNIRDFMERRLQSVVFKKGLARSMKQSRQFITHNHVKVNDKKISVPSYLVSKQEEQLINFAENSTLVNPDHPERKTPGPQEPEKEKPNEKKSAAKEKKSEKAKPEKDEEKKEGAEAKPEEDKGDKKEEESAEEPKEEAKPENKDAEKSEDTEKATEE